MSYGFGYNYSWWYSIIFLIFNYGLNIMFKHNFRNRFNNVPYLKFYTEISQVSFYLLLILSLFVKLKSVILVIVGSLIYLLGLGIYISSMYFFAINEYNKVVTSGVYKLSRHPVYLGFFIMFFGVFISTLNIFVLILNALLGIASYKIALQEEKDCLNNYNFEYKKYMNKVKRIL